MFSDLGPMLEPEPKFQVRSDRGQIIVHSHLMFMDSYIQWFGFDNLGSEVHVH